MQRGEQDEDSEEGEEETGSVTPPPLLNLQESMPLMQQGKDKTAGKCWAPEV